MTKTGGIFNNSGQKMERKTAKTNKTAKKTTSYGIDKNSIKILGIRVNLINLKNALDLVEKWVKSNKQHQITTPNPEQIVLAQSDYRFKKVINQSDLAIPDGIGLIWAARCLKKLESKKAKSQKSSITSQQSPIITDHLASQSAAEKKWWGIKKTISNLAEKNIKNQSGYCLSSTNLMSKLSKLVVGLTKCYKLEDANRFDSGKSIKSNGQSIKKQTNYRLSGTDLMLELCKLAAKRKWSVFLLGGKNKVAEKAASNLAETCKLRTIGHFSGAQNIKKQTNEELKEAIERINKFQPQLLFVAYGAPEQEKWIADNLYQLKVKVAMGVGGAFDYLAGKTKRAPMRIRKMGLEWLWRLLNQPWRFRRQLALLKFIYLVIRERLRRTSI